MGGASSFFAMLAISCFLFAIWTMGKISKAIGISSIVLELGMGLILGPSIANLLPQELSVCVKQHVVDCDTEDGQMKIAEEDTEYCDLGAYLEADIYTPGKHYTEGFFGNVTSVTLKGHEYFLDGSHDDHHRRLAGGGNEGKTDYDSYSDCLKEQCLYKQAMECATVPDVFTLTGHIGVAMMIFESGMHFDFDQAKIVGPWACAVAVLGTFLPIVFGILLCLAFEFPLFPDAIAAGVSLAPTSVGIALKLLNESQALHLPFGQTVMTAAFVDDVLSLILFSVLFSMGGPMEFMTFFPLIMGCLFMVVAIVAAVTVFPKFIALVFSMVPEDKADTKITRHDEVLWVLMFATLIAYATITHFCGTHLWGCFIAGMSFATNHDAHRVWVRQVKRVTCWFLRIFFASTLAWSIPVESLFDATALWKGTLMGIGPCVLTKVLCAPFMGRPKWVIGWAMVGRAEFAYFIAIMAKSLKMMSDELFAVLIWALIYATIFAPLVFRYVLTKYMATVDAEREAEREPEPIAADSSLRNVPELPNLDLQMEDIDARHDPTLGQAGLPGDNDIKTYKMALKTGEVEPFESQPSQPSKKTLG